MMNKELTKEECLEALERLSNPPFESTCGGCGGDCEDCVDMKAVWKLEELINEHFDNPPLKFEELQDGMVVWDNLWKEYIQLKKSFNERWIYYLFGVTVMYTLLFEENRFYRHEVKENKE